MFGGDGFGPLLERLEAGDLVTILFQGLAVLTFDHGDPLGRDLVIASLVRLGLKGLTVATLCRVSPAHVSGVRRRVAAGGLAALAKRGTGGVAWTIQGAALARLRELHGQGASYGKIARRLRRPKSTVVAAVKRLEATALAADAQPTLPRVASAPPVAPTTDMARADSPAADLASEAPALIWGEDELAPGAWLPDGPAAHDSRYAGTLLLCAAADEIGVHDAITAAHVTRPETAIYPARQALTALLASWTSGSGSIEAMHERDAAALGIVLGLERSPSVRTLHRSIRQMTATYDAAAWSVALFHGVARAFGPRPVQLFGVDGHVKAYKGTAPIDKGWDSKRRLAVKALSEIRVSDDRGVTWWSFDVGAGDALSKHLVAAGTSLRGVMGTDRPLVLASDRGGFDFAVLDAIAREGLYYVAYVPASVTLPELDTIAPPTDGVGEQLWRHPRLHHPSRLLVERDAVVCVPATTNLPTLVAAAAAMELLRTARGWQENGIKAARAFAHIDGLVDRGGASYAPDDRLVRHPAHTVQHATRERALEAVEALAKVRPQRGHRTLAQIEGQELVAGLRVAIEKKKLQQIPKKVPRTALDPSAQRAWLKTKNRALLAPLKNASDNARRWLLEALGSALSPTEHAYDASARTRTLLALLRAPGRVQFDGDRVVVTLTMNLPPTPHQRLSDALVALDTRGLRFTDGRRRVTFRLAPRTLRRDLADARVAHPRTAEPNS